MEGCLVSICQTVVFILAIWFPVWPIGLSETFNSFWQLTAGCLFYRIYHPRHMLLRFFLLLFLILSQIFFFFNVSELCMIFLWDENWPRPGGAEWRRLCSSFSFPLLGPFRVISVKLLNTFPAIPAMTFSSSFIFTGPRVSSFIRIMRINTPWGILYINFYTGLHLHLSFFFVINCKKCAWIWIVSSFPPATSKDHIIHAMNRLSPGLDKTPGNTLLGTILNWQGIGPRDLIGVFHLQLLMIFNAN